MKLKTICLSMLAIAALTSCNNDDDGLDKGTVVNADVAYLSIRIETQQQLRASGTNQGENESTLNELYLITFDDQGNITGIPGTTNYFTRIEPSNMTPEAQKISAASTRLMVVANPGSKLKNVLTTVNATSTFSSVNAAIQDVAEDEITNSGNAVKSFTMINSGDDKGLSEGNNLTAIDLLVDITGKIIKQEEGETEAQAKAKAEETANRVSVKLERLTSKLELKEGSQIAVSPSGANFSLGNWTVDAVNTTFFPCAAKTILSVPHTPTHPFYTHNFYTRDPNYTSTDATLGEGLAFASVDPDTFDPILLTAYGWKDPSTSLVPSVAYCIENTMDAASQKFGNATRIVIKGQYSPPGHPNDGSDWFNFAGTNYLSLADLQKAYELETSVNLKTACDNMYDKIKAHSDAKSLGITAGSFDALTEGDLAKIDNGGEVIKDGKNNVIRWYQNSLNYYYYEIRHDNEATEEMTLGKYGVVRNNYYSLTLTSVGGPGSPWYPDINNPGPGDPDPGDDLDEAAGYLGITIEVAPWVIWENEISI